MHSFEFPIINDFSPDKMIKRLLSPIDGGIQQATALREYWKGLSGYMNEIFVPYFIAMDYMSDVESKRIFEENPVENIRSLIELMKFNMDITTRSASGSLKALNEYAENEMTEAFSAFLNTLFYKPGEDLIAYFRRQARVLNAVTHDYPEAINNIGPEFGFHFEKGIDKLIAETDRYLVYQISPDRKSVV
jgi:hypothetical protein